MLNDGIRTYTQFCDNRSLIAESITSAVSATLPLVAGTLDTLILEADFFKGLLSKALEKVCAGYKKRSVDKGGFFFNQEDPAEYLYLLAGGRVRMGCF